MGKYFIIRHVTSSKSLLYLRISKKLGKANKRNLLKRRLREIFRKLKINHHIIIFSKNILPTYKEMQEDLKNIFQSFEK